MHTLRPPDVGSILAIGVDYAGTSHPPLPETISGAERLAGLFSQLGFPACHVPEQIEQADSIEILQVITNWATSSAQSMPSAKLVLYIGAHGRLHMGRYFLLARNSPAKPPYTALNAISTIDIVECIVNSGVTQALVMIDGCRSGSGALEMEQVLGRHTYSVASTPSRIAVIASALHHELSYSGLFVEAVVEAIVNGSVGQAHWRNIDPFITAGELCDELVDRLGSHQYATVAGRDSIRIIPNPLFVPPAPDRPAEFGNLLSHLRANEREHFLLKASGADVIDIGWYFSGRRSVTSRILEWADNADRGVFVLTGPPGSGKSAILGRLAVLADLNSQGACEALGLTTGDPGMRPRVGLFDAVIHLKNRSLNDSVREVAHALNIPTSTLEPAASLVIECLLAQSAKPRLILFDALDEALHGYVAAIASELVVGLARVPGVRVIVGTREVTTSTPVGDGPSSIIGLILDADGDSVAFNLRDDADADSSISAYVEKRLTQNWADLEATRVAGTGVAAIAAGVFLIARFAVRALEGRNSNCVYDPSWVSVVLGDVASNGLQAAVDRDLARFDDYERARDMLSALGYSYGKGLPRREIWPAVASEISPTGRTYTEADALALVNEGAWYLIESLEGDQVVYRIFHEAISDLLSAALASDPEEAAEISHRVTQCMIEIGKSEEWADANPYIRHYLSAHAGASNDLSDLVNDPGFMVVADPEVLIESVWSCRTLPIIGLLSLYIQIGESLRGRTPAERRAMLALQFAINRIDCPYRSEDDSLWWPNWAAIRPPAFHRKMLGHRGPVFTVSGGKLLDRPLLISGAQDGSALIWDLSVGSSIGRLSPSSTWIRSVGLSTENNGCFFSAEGRILKLWSSDSFTLIDSFDAGVGEILDFCSLPGRANALAIAGDTGSVRIWIVNENRCSGELMHGDWVRAVASAIVADETLLACGGDENSISLWSYSNGNWGKCGHLYGHEDSVTDLTFIAGSHGENLLVSSSMDQTIRVWDPVAMELMKTLDGHTDWVSGVARVSDQGKVRIASSSNDGTVRVWDPFSGECLRICEGHSGVVWSVTELPANQQRMLFASAGQDRTVRIWSETGGEIETPPLTNIVANTTAISASLSCGSEFVVSGDSAGFLQIWDSSNGRPRIKWRAHHGEVTDIAITSIGDLNVWSIASVGHDGRVCLWSTSGQKVIEYSSSKSLQTVDIHVSLGRQFVCVGGEDRVVSIWDLASGTVVSTLAGHSEWIRDNRFVTVGEVEYVVTASTDGSLRLWEWQTGRCCAIMSGHREWVRAVLPTVIDGEQLIVSGGDDGIVRLWQFDGSLVLQESVTDGAITSISASLFRGRRVVLIVAASEEAIVWRPDSGVLVRIPIDGVNAVACTGESMFFATNRGVLSLKNAM
ncbi:hypothetical protein [Nocardia sp. NPDC060249]|uniref:hypothetical protein n=1 Tax=Nocardia sp. NPDC060249 TaxID=3347082 RepID=UPI00365F9C84